MLVIFFFVDVILIVSLYWLGGNVIILIEEIWIIWLLILVFVILFLLFVNVFVLFIFEVVLGRLVNI